jgi:cobalt transporter subunit CbtB
MNTLTTATVSAVAPALDLAAPLSRAVVLRSFGAAAALGLVLLYGVAFADSPVAHNAAHDVRHITVKPCH